MQTTYRTPIELGTTVYGSDDQKIGDVAEIQQDFFVIEKGFIFTKDLYIPLSTIGSQDPDGIHLTMTKDEVEHRDWSTPPPLEVQTDSDPVGRQGTSVSDREVQSFRDEQLDDVETKRR